MRYIRTKDNIYDERELYNYCGVYYKESLRIGRLVASADTIEELCDSFIVETDGNVKLWVDPKLENAKMYYGIKNIYGTIWVSGKKNEPILKTIAIYKDGKWELL